MSNNNFNREDNNTILAMIATLKAENEALKAKVKPKATGMKVTEKGGVSVYGLGRFPVTLYKGQWESLLAKAEEIKAFLEANKDKLSVRE